MGESIGLISQCVHHSGRKSIDLGRHGIVSSLLHWRDSGASYLLAGGALYLLGTLWVTALFNVPRNDTLAAVDPTAPDAAVLWTSYLSEWTVWNHVRAAAAFAAATRRECRLAPQRWRGGAAFDSLRPGKRRPTFSIF